MPVKKRAAKARRFKINDEVVEAYRDRDFLGLHRALGLGCWEMSPLPLAEEPLGCDPLRPPPEQSTYGWDHSWQQAVDLQAELEAALKGTR
jgi:hypothetical protein